MATNDLVSHQQKNGNNNNNDEEKKGKKRSNVYRNGRVQCSIGEPVCGETGAEYKVAGPLWLGPLHDTEVVNDAIRLKNLERVPTKINVF